ncbi:transposase [Streptacidiphilus rugosus]|uniref:transposase n=1 Tax=Streptacidiphilus rugosus TaxID=405783 RepID=UPI001E40F1AB|nr:transposase [Streptacidiphilus rugosus]
MSLEPRADRGVPELTARVVRASFPKGTQAVRIREALGPLCEDAAFAQAFPARGRPAVSPGALALVSVLQYAEGLSDRQAADQVRARMDWKFLLGLEPNDPGFDFTVLGDFRARLVEHGLEEKVLDLFPSRCSELGLLRAGDRQRTDSTHVLASVRVLNRMEFVGETLRAALEALAVAAPAWLATLDRLLPVPDGRQRPGPVGRAGRPGRVRGAGRRVRARRPGLAAGSPRSPGPAPGLDRAVPPRRAGGALAGGQGPPAGQTPPVLALRHRRPLQRQARLRMGRVQDPDSYNANGNFEFEVVAGPTSGLRTRSVAGGDS